MMAACWFAVMKAGGVCVATMPLLRAKELTDIIRKAEVTHALCDKRLEAELQAARRPARPEAGQATGTTTAPDALDALALKQPLWFTNVADRRRRRGADRLHLRHDRQAQGHDAFPSRRGGDVRLLPALHASRRSKDDVFCGTPPLAFTFGLGGMLCFPMRSAPRPCWSRSTRPRRLLETIERFRATVCFTAPTCTGRWPRIAADFDLSSLKTLRLGRRSAAGRHAPAVQARRRASRSSTASARPR